MLMIAMAFAAQATVLPDRPWTYVSAEEARQTPCPAAVPARGWTL